MNRQWRGDGKIEKMGDAIFCCVGKKILQHNVFLLVDRTFFGCANAITSKAKLFTSAPNNISDTRSASEVQYSVLKCVQARYFRRHQELLMCRAPKLTATTKLFTRTMLRFS